MSKKLSFWVSDNLMTQLACRGPNSKAIRQALERYYYILGAERRAIRDTFTNPELRFIVDVCRDASWGSTNIRANIHELCLEAPLSLYGKYRVDRGILAHKLIRLTLAPEAALADAIERFWLRHKNGEQPKVEELLA